MSLLTIITDACDLLRIARPSVVVASTDQGVRMLYAQARYSLQALANEHDWNELVSEGTITLVNGTQSYSLASDFLRLKNETTWDRTNDQQQDIPITAQEWAYLKGEGLNTSLNRRARLINGKMEFYDTIGAGDDGNSIKYEYISSNLALNGSTPTAGLTVDSYTARLPEYLVTLAVVWRYRQDRGEDWRPSYDLYRRECQKYMGANRSSRGVSMAGGVDTTPMGVTIQDRGYG